MRLSSFRVRGFKNLTREVVLEDLGPVNVLHGPNNVGKSNVLQAMQMFFRLLRRGDQRRINVGATVQLVDAAWSQDFGMARRSAAGSASSSRWASSRTFSARARSW
jgi:AAA15 family ATPase/GTPase